MKQMVYLPRIARIAIAAAVLSAASLAFAGQAVDDAEARNQEICREAIAQTPVPTEGCFQTTYPSLTWNKVECVVAANIPFMPRSGRMSQTVGNGNDYVAEVSSGQINTTIGTFPTVTGVKTETGLLGANDYSLQINSNVQNTATCNGAGNPAECLVWQQFVYSSGYKQAFIQYWLINWNNPCPSGWWTSGSDCYMNSAAVTVPKEPITKLNRLMLSGLANEGGIDALVFTNGTKAYSTTGSDSVLDLASFWTESEFNIVGDADASEANFNSGSSLTVQVVVLNGTTDAPTCKADKGTTGETNNLSLGSCAGTGGASPYIEFTENNTETVLYSFSGGSDGSEPNGSLVRDTAGNLYGTTGNGGTYGLGVVFKLTASGKEKVLHSFKGGTDGANPESGLIRDAAGNLYGTTDAGGAQNFGVVFQAKFVWQGDRTARFRRWCGWSSRALSSDRGRSGQPVRYHLLWRGVWRGYDIRTDSVRPRERALQLYGRHGREPRYGAGGGRSRKPLRRCARRRGPWRSVRVDIVRHRECAPRFWVGRRVRP